MAHSDSESSFEIETYYSTFLLKKQMKFLTPQKPAAAITAILPANENGLIPCSDLSNPTLEQGQYLPAFEIVQIAHLSLYIIMIKCVYLNLGWNDEKLFP